MGTCWRCTRKFSATWQHQPSTHCWRVCREPTRILPTPRRPAIPVRVQNWSRPHPPPTAHTGGGTLHSASLFDPSLPILDAYHLQCPSGMA